MNPPNPPPGGVDPLVAAQMAVMQQMADTMADMRAQMQQERQEMRQEREDIRQELRQEREEIRQERRAQQQQLQQQLQQQQQVPLPPPPPPVPPRDKHREFMSHKPPTFASSPDPLDADHWLKSVEKMLNIVQCTDWGNNASADEGHQYLTFYVALFLIHSI
jgi:TolA-binding protein